MGLATGVEVVEWGVEVVEGGVEEGEGVKSGTSSKMSTNRFLAAFLYLWRIPPPA